MRKGAPSQPLAQQTTFGCILSGVVCAAGNSDSATTLQCTVGEDLNTVVRRFWEQEELSEPSGILSREEQQCEEIFVRTRGADGRYLVRLPVVGLLPDFASSHRVALRCLNHMEKRFQRDPTLQKQYQGFMREYESLGHMIPAEPLVEGQRGCFLPHHGVFKASSITKLRVVFNGSSPVTNGDTLNCHLSVGANLLPAISDILTRWRRHKYVIVADIEKMYQQILVHPEDQDLQRILWRNSPGEPAQEYKLTTVTYGLSCAPYLAMRTLQQLAEDERANFPLGAAALREDSYVDDVLTGADSLEDSISIRRKLTQLCMAGGFPLRKWAANCEDLLQGVPSEHRAQPLPHTLESLGDQGTLGLRWHPQTDEFSFVVRSEKLGPITKRFILSQTAKLYDPLGWLAPVVVRAKIMFQTIWLRHLDWDQPLEETDAAACSSFRKACRNWSGLDDYGRVSTSLIASKTKVAPIKQVSLPRLELCAAALLTRLAFHFRALLSIPVEDVHLWTDSMVTLSWIQGHPVCWKTYVANCVSEIQRTLPEARWHHVKGVENPADCAFRGLTPGELLKHELWWQGPSWLTTSSANWTAEPTCRPMNEPPGARSTIHAVKARTDAETQELTQFSSLHRLLRVTAWCLRWLKAGCGRCGEPPSTLEIREAHARWITIVQGQAYPTEMRLLRENRAGDVRGPLSKLTPFIDADGKVRVDGRLKHSLLSFNEKHPVILLHDFTALCVIVCHRRTLHGKVQLTLRLLRQQFWIPRGRMVVKQRIRKCITCTRWQAAFPQPLMGNLPTSRVTPGRPFLDTGVDYAGPVPMRTSPGRGQRGRKGFIAVFICLATRAVHLEAVSDCLTDGFLAAFRRFVSRRGMCRTMHSDCGTNFVRADAQLRNMFWATSVEARHIAERVAHEGVEW
ncbi:uncharacterized protein LOC114937014 [Nylanderia fulva]|uniref:uncharacterized protein LOC114937014 n=1 Tax=Nylanderia fulva TaxID=613905 RepID=UPI0010FBB3F6|nr:uncharacterized protein LOC114937014 [Nylanderia fulva]